MFCTNEKLRMLVMERVLILSIPNANSNCSLYSRFVNVNIYIYIYIYKAM